MIDIKWIKDNKEKFNQLCKLRGENLSAEHILNLYEEKKSLVTLIQKLQESKNSKDTLMVSLKNNNPRVFEEVRKDASHINNKLKELKIRLEEANKVSEIIKNIPNLLDESVPKGENDMVIKTFGPINSNPYHHIDIAEKLGLMEWKNTTNMSGRRFVTLLSQLSKLERALVSMMLDMHTKAGFKEVSPPYMVKESALYNSGQLPKFDEDSFKTTDGYRLIPTSEVPLVNLVADSLLKLEELPIRYTAATPCFRSEAGSAGKDTKGIIRMHQFLKVEMVSITDKNNSYKEHEFLLDCAEKVLQALGLSYKVVNLCSKEIGFTASKTYDIEVWMPGSSNYREIVSCSNCTDFQARRMKARYREDGSKDSIFVHTLNSTGLAIGRTIAAILENFYNPKTNTVKLPKAIVPYMGGIEEITKE